MKYGKINKATISCHGNITTGKTANNAILALQSEVNLKGIEWPPNYYFW